MSSFDTKISFELPKGYLDPNGQTHKNGTMRLANAVDEIIPMSDPRVKINPAYLSILLLSRVITDLGTLKEVTPNVIEKLYTADVAYLQDLYQKINAIEPPSVDVTCPQCTHKFMVQTSFLQ
ncbi:MAG: phage tail assembly protein [Firmicutes bacterium]|nr:phage tail assembly protein [Bacillota bacterium]